MGERDRIGAIVQQMLDAGEPEAKISEFVAKAGQRMKLQAKSAKTQAEIKALQAQADAEGGVGGYAKSIGREMGDRLAGIGQGAKALAGAVRHPIDTLMSGSKRRQLVRGVDDMVTLGYGQKLAGAIDPAYAATASADQAAEPGMRAGGGLVGMAMPGASTGIARGALGVTSRAISPQAGIIRQGIAGGTRGALAAEIGIGASEGLRAGGGSLKERLTAAAEAGTDPTSLLMAGGMGAAGGAVGGVLKRAPERKMESELGGLREGVQYKTRIRTLEPNEPDIRAELNADPKLRAVIKQDPRKAAALVDDKLATVAEGELNPYYEQLKATGQDKIPVAPVLAKLKKVRDSFHDIQEESQVAYVDHLMQKYAAKAEANGGTLPAEYVRQGATSAQTQGYANLPMFGQVPLGKEAKQGVGNALRGSIAEHVESVSGDPAVREAFSAASKKASTWYAIKSIVDEKAKRLKQNATPMGDLVGAAQGMIRHPVITALNVAKPVGDVIDRRILGPAMQTRAGQALGNLAEGPGINPLMAAQAIEAEKKKQRSRDRAAALRRQ